MSSKEEDAGLPVQQNEKKNNAGITTDQKRMMDMYMLQQLVQQTNNTQRNVNINAVRGPVNTPQPLQFFNYQPPIASVSNIPQPMTAQPIIPQERGKKRKQPEKPKAPRKSKKQKTTSKAITFEPDNETVMPPQPPQQAVAAPTPTNTPQSVNNQPYQLQPFEREILDYISNPDIDEESLKLFCIENEDMIPNVPPNIAQRMRDAINAPPKQVPAQQQNNLVPPEPPENTDGIVNDINAAVESKTGFERALSQDEISRLPEEYKKAYLEGKYDPIVFRDYAILNGLIAPTEQEQDPLFAEFNALGSSNITDKITKCSQIIKKYLHNQDLKELMLGVHKPKLFATAQDDDSDDECVMIVDEREGKLQELDRTLLEVRKLINPYKASEHVVKVITQTIERCSRIKSNK